jgi:hypothetical protein
LDFSNPGADWPLIEETAAETHEQSFYLNNGQD